jgi:hypothetical protein
LDTEEEYKHSYHQFLSFLDSDLAKEGLGHAPAHILEGYLVESFHQKEHRMVKVRVVDLFPDSSSEGGLLPSSDESLVGGYSLNFKKKRAWACMAQL